MQANPSSSFALRTLTAKAVTLLLTAVAFTAILAYLVTAFVANNG